LWTNVKDEDYVMKLAFSTSWADGKIERVREILPYIDALEIGSKGTGAFFRDLEKLIGEEGVPVTSMHAVCYPHKEIHDTYYTPDFASLDRTRRLLEIEHLAQTAQWAIQMGNRALIIHTGRVEDETLKTDFLLYKRRFLNGENPIELKEQFHELRRKRNLLSSTHLDSVMDVLGELCPKFPEVNFLIETRLHYYEIPLPDELEIILNTLPYSNLGYWHDIGHTYLLDALRFVSMDSWQRRFSGRCGGVHVHDTDESLLDHYPPGEGTLDLRSILEQFSSLSILTLEINSRNSLESVIKGMRHLRRLAISVL
jgi:sugar phosphate isomerase/epimerase